jgi:hypothetical protein
MLSPYSKKTQTKRQQEKWEDEGEIKTRNQKVAETEKNIFT